MLPLAAAVLEIAVAGLRWPRQPSHRYECSVDGHVIADRADDAWLADDALAEVLADRNRALGKAISLMLPGAFKCVFAGQSRCRRPRRQPPSTWLRRMDGQLDGQLCSAFGPSMGFLLSSASRPASSTRSTQASSGSSNCGSYDHLGRRLEARLVTI